MHQYREDEPSNFTHAGKKYSLNKIFGQVENQPIIQIPIEELKWILEYAIPNPEREKNADLSTPILIHKLEEKWATIDRLHRLAKAAKLKINTLPARIVSDDMLAKAQIINEKISSSLKRICSNLQKN